jgi:hypothetical protein
MQTMANLRRELECLSALIALCLALSLSQGCARAEPLHRTDSSSPESEQKLPFHPDTEHASASDGEHSAVLPDPKVASGLPFRAVSRILPSGTLLTVQLEDSLSTAKMGVGDSFTASVAAPLTIDGDTLVERGTAATGRVESAQSNTGSGYFRLTLSAITIGGRQLALQTSSLFARGTFQQSKVSSRGSPSALPSDGVRVQKGRRLTFRLTAPVTLNDPSSMAHRQYRGLTSTE